MLIITSKSSSIDLVPIVIDDKITYIAPMIGIYDINIDIIMSNSRYVGYIGNSYAFKIAKMMLNLRNGTLEDKTEEEVLSIYYQYSDNFWNKNNDKEVYRNKNCTSPYYMFLTSRDMEKNIHYSKETPRYIVNSTVNNETEIKPVEIATPEVKIEQTVVITSKQEEQTLDKPTFIVPLKNSELLSALAEMEKLPAGSNTLQIVDFMSEEDIMRFLAYKELNTVKKAAILYGCSTGKINMRFNQIRDKYNIYYKQGE
jgi:hypothetical protein